MTQPKAPKIEFPCKDYPIKILGEATEAFKSEVIELVKQHASELDEQRITMNQSRNGRFNSVTVFITATGVEQLKALHEALLAHPGIKMVL